MNVYKLLNGLKYEKELTELFEKALFGEWMSPDEKNEALGMFFELCGKNASDLDSDIATGVRHGYSVEYQIGLFEQALNLKEGKL